MELPDLHGVTKRQAKCLLQLLGELHEKAYRRGFQHGHCAGLGLYGFGPPPSERQVARWRFRGYADTEPPPDGSSEKRKQPGHGVATVIERMVCESEGDLADWLRVLEMMCEPRRAENGASECQPAEAKS